MAGWYLINNLRLGRQQFFAGAHVDDRTIDAAAITAAGGILAPDSNPACVKAAKLCEKLRRGGAAPEELQSLMVGAIGSTLFALPTGGGGANSVQKVAFDWRSGSPIVLQAVTSQNILLHASFAITTAFDGAGAFAELGTSANPGQVFGPGEVSLGQKVTYDCLHSIAGFVPDNFILTLTLNGSTRGAGMLVYEME